MRIRDLRAVYQIVAQSIVPFTDSLCRYRMHAGNVYSPGSHRTRSWPSKYWTQKRDSSEKATLCRFCINLCSLAHKSSCHFLWCIASRSLSSGCEADSPCCCRRRRTIQEENRRTANISISWLMVPLYVYQCDGEIHGRIILTLDRQQSSFYWNAFAGIHFFSLFDK